MYGFLAPIVARRLGLAESDPQGLLIVGVDPFTRALGHLLAKRGVAVLLVDTNRDHTRPARLEGLPTHTGSVLGEDFLDRVSLGGIGRVLAMTPNPFVNVLTVHRFEKVFGTANCYQVAPERKTKKGDSHENVAGRVLFEEEATHDWLNDWMAAEGQIKATLITEEFTFDDYRSYHGSHARPILAIDDSNRLRLFTAGEDPAPKAGETIVSLVDAEDPDVAAQAVTTREDTEGGPEKAPVP